jgi:hypothetical protein
MPRITRAMTVPSFAATFIDVIGGREAASRGHVLHDDGRIACNVLAHVPRHQARLGVVAAAGARANDEADLLAGVELRDRLRAGRGGRP